MLPTVIVNIILEFHDIFDIATKKQKINKVIKNAYNHWALDYGVNPKFNFTEHEAKTCLYPYISGNCFITDPVNWLLYINYYRYYDKVLK